MLKCPKTIYITAKENTRIFSRTWSYFLYPLKEEQMTGAGNQSIIAKIRIT